MCETELFVPTLSDECSYRDIKQRHSVFASQRGMAAVYAHITSAFISAQSVLCLNVMIMYTTFIRA